MLLLACIVAYVFSGRQYVRGAWITGFGSGYLTPAEVDRTIAAAKAAKLNLLIVEVRKSADAYYRSDMEPLALGVAPGFDPLADLLEKAHAEGIKVHAWVSVYRVWRGNSHPTDPRHLANRHPEWLCLSREGVVNAPDGIFVDPGVPEAVNYTVKVVADIVRSYNIDGLHLDFVRYPDRRWGYSQAALARYRGETRVEGTPSPDDALWQQWRREQVTNSVRTIRRVVERLKPGLPISAATIAYGDCSTEFADTFAYKYLGQDWWRWLSEDLLDANMPMNYRDARRPESLQQFRDWLPAFRKWGAGKPVFVGLAAYMNDSDSLTEQIEEVRRHDMDGFVVFCFNESGIRVVQSRHSLARTLAGTDSWWRKWRTSGAAFLKNR